MSGITSGPLAITGSAVVSKGRCMCHCMCLYIVCSAYRACSCSLFFKAPYPYPPFIIRVLIGHRRSENSSATTQNSPAKFCLFPDRALPFHDNPPFTLQYSPVSPILNETPVLLYYLYCLIHYSPSRFSTVLPFQCDGCWGWGAGAGFFWQAWLVAGFQAGWTVGCLGLG